MPGLQHAAVQAPNKPRIWYVFGLLYRSDNKPHQSMEAFRRVLKLDPTNADSHYFLGSFFLTSATCRLPRLNFAPRCGSHHYTRLPNLDSPVPCNVTAKWTRPV